MVYLLFFCSGVSGLIYQVVWVRAFGNVFGNTIYSASLVIAVFMLGLGAGSYLAGRWADRRYAANPNSLLRIFGAFELSIAVLAVGVSALLPHLTDLSASLSSYTVGPAGWYVLSSSSHVARAALAAGLLAPITLLMGGTLTLLIRHLVRRDLRRGAWQIALLYGVNTAGAAMGAFLTDFALVPNYGLQRTQWVAFGFNIVAAAGALYIGRGPVVRLKPDTTIEEREPARVRSVRLQPDQVTPEPAIRWTAAAIALSGFAAMGMEIVWFRHVSLLLGEYRAVFSLLLTIVLCGIGLGSLAGGWLLRRVQQPAQAWMVVQGLFVAATLAGLASVDARAIQQAASDPGGMPRALAEVWFNAGPIFAVAGLPSILMGFAFPLANAVVQRAESQVGARAGLMYLANTVGAVGGSLAAGFVLLPVLGLQRSATALMIAAVLAIASLHGARRADSTNQSRRAPWAFAGSLGVAAAALAGWVLLPGDFLLARGLLFPVENAHAVSEGLTEIITVTDGPDGGRVLVTNGHPMSSTELFSQRYMRAMAHIPLLSIERPRRVLVLCYGVGNTAHAATLHPSVERVDVVDLSGHVLEHSRYFTDVNHDVLRDPRVSVYINDGRHHLQMAAPEWYDLITLEPPPIVHAGVAALYSREFYVSARSRLTPRGYISQWLPVFGVPEPMILSMVRAFTDVFPNAVLLSGAQTNLLLVGTRDSTIEVDPARVEAALAQTPAVRADLQRLDLGTLREIVGTFVASGETLAAAASSVTPVTDDRPIQEYGKRSLLDFDEGGIPSSIVAVGEVASWCPGCFNSGKPSESVEGIQTYLALTELAYRSPPPSGLPKGRTVFGSGYLGAIVPDSPTVRQLLEGPAAEPAVADSGARYTRATTLLEAGRYAEAVNEFRAVVKAAPDAVQAHNNLGVALASLGRMDEAIDAFERALALQPDFADARRNLAFAREQQARRPGSF
jgi:predicted membrane-bound spermidine synthase